MFHSWQPLRDLRFSSIESKVYNSHESSQTKILSFFAFPFIAEVCLEGIVNPDKRPITGLHTLPHTPDVCPSIPGYQKEYSVSLEKLRLEYRSRAITTDVCTASEPFADIQADRMYVLKARACCRRIERRVENASVNSARINSGIKSIRYT